MGRTTWLTAFGEAWKKRAGTEPNWKRLAGELGSVKRSLKEKGLTEAQARNRILYHWLEYLDQTPIRFLSPTRFRETFNGHDPRKNAAHRIDRELDRRQRAKERRVAPRNNPASEPSPVQVDFPM